MPVHRIHGGPTHCRTPGCGAAMDYPNGSVGWTGCKCDSHHRTWTCDACGGVDCITRAAAGLPPYIKG